MDDDPAAALSGALYPAAVRRYWRRRPTSIRTNIFKCATRPRMTTLTVQVNRRSDYLKMMASGSTFLLQQPTADPPPSRAEAHIGGSSRQEPVPPNADEPAPAASGNKVMAGGY